MCFISTLKDVSKNEVYRAICLYLADLRCVIVKLMPKHSVAHTQNCLVVMETPFHCKF